MRLLLLPLAFVAGFWLMLPSLIRDRVPLRHYPAAVLYALFCGSKR